MNDPCRPGCATRGLRNLGVSLSSASPVCHPDHQPPEARNIKKATTKASFGCRSIRTWAFSCPLEKGQSWWGLSAHAAKVRLRYAERHRTSLETHIWDHLVLSFFVGSFWGWFKRSSKVQALGELSPCPPCPQLAPHAYHGSHLSSAYAPSK